MNTLEKAVADIGEKLDEAVGLLRIIAERLPAAHALVPKDQLLSTDEAMRITGYGDPQSFRDAMRKAGIHSASVKPFRWLPGDIARWQSSAKESGPRFRITSKKKKTISANIAVAGDSGQRG